jgi:cytochrome b6-f complex iron-sulfur subunit
VTETPPGHPRNEEPAGRRRILRWMSRGFLSLWGLAFCWVFASFLEPPRSGHGLSDRMIKLGRLDSLPRGQARVVRHGDRPIVVVRTADDSLVGLSAVCTHLNCVVTWDPTEGVLRCPCHDGAFDVNGNVLSGPPPRPLERYRIEVRLGEVFLYL